jgi:regulator of sigma E protease
MSSLNTIVQLVIVISALIILHEIGHYLGARLFKLKVDEFGIGIPPQFLRYWRTKGSFSIDGLHVIVPAGRKILQDIEEGTWVDVEVVQNDDIGYVLKSLSVPDPKIQSLERKREVTSSGSILIRNSVSEVNLGMVFTLNLLPLGGFVKIRGEGDPSIPDGLAASNPWKRVVVYGFGPLINLLVGVVLYTIIVIQLGVADPTSVKVLEVAQNSPAEAAGLTENDLLISIDDVEVVDILSVHNAIYDRLGTEIEVTLQRDGNEMAVAMVPRINPPEGEGAIGIVMGYPIKKVSFLEAIPYGVISTYQHSIALITLPAQVVKGVITPAEARPVGYKGMYDLYQDVQEQELVPGAPQSLNTIWFFTTITISLGILNLLPIPALDGGRILFALPEILFRRKIPIQVQNTVNFISFTLLILLFFYINYLDFVNPVQIP